MEAVSYILRVWLEPSAQNIWRASLTETKTQQKHYFSSPQALLSFMAENLEACYPENLPELFGMDP